MTENTGNVLVLGTDGLVGHTVFNYLYKKNPATTFGTTRKNKKNQKNIFSFTANDCESDYQKICTSILNVAYVINCIGSTKQRNLSFEDFFVNADFPHYLEKITSVHNSRLIHISTDAVFSPTEKVATEDTIPSPMSEYAIAKYKGETTAENALTIRSSFIGFYKEKNTGLLEWLRHTEGKTVEGYSNQNWSGCTTLQFAKLCDGLITKNYFSVLRSKKNVFHFSPLSTTKYEILQTTAQFLKLKVRIQRTTNTSVTRVLKSLFTTNDILLESETNLLATIKKAWQFEYRS